MVDDPAQPNSLLTKVLIRMFAKRSPNLCVENSTLRMRQLLQLYASDSSDLISRYYWERIKEQRNLQVIIKCQ